MKFSIITVTYNSARYLAEAMASVLSQEGVDLEYILVDGSSTDATLEIIRELAVSDARVSWTSEPDQGIADAFNKGIIRASGEIIGILNSDDKYSPGALKAVAAAWQADPGCDVFHGDMVRFDEDRPLFVLKPARIGSNVWWEMPLNHPATFVTKRAYHQVGLFDSQLRYAMDYELVLRLYCHGCRFCYLEQVLAGMRYGGASDERFVEARREVVAITVRAGYPPVKAWWWFVYKVGMGATKNLLRRLGLYSLIQLHPRFRKSREAGSGTGRESDA